MLWKYLLVVWSLERTSTVCSPDVRTERTQTLRPTVYLENASTLHVDMRCTSNVMAFQLDTSVRHLFVTNSSLRHLFVTNSSLRHLFVTNSSLRHLPSLPTVRQRLLTLNVSSSRIRELPDATAWSTFPQLQTLSLRRNLLKLVGRRSVRHRRLQLLDLADNSIAVVQSGALELAPKLEQFFLHGNMLTVLTDFATGCGAPAGLRDLGVDVQHAFDCADENTVQNLLDLQNSEIVSGVHLASLVCAEPNVFRMMPLSSFFHVAESRRIGRSADPDETGGADCIDSTDCLNDGKCINSTCRCQLQFYGAACQLDFNECDNTPCVNGATCLNEFGGFTCSCSTNDDKCYSSHVDPTKRNTTQAGFPSVPEVMVSASCNSTGCQNGGSCVREIDGFRCFCPSEFSGTFCELSDSWWAKDYANPFGTRPPISIPEGRAAGKLRPSAFLALALAWLALGLASPRMHR